MQIKRMMKSNIIISKSYQYFRAMLTILSPKLNTIVTFRIAKGKPLHLKNPVTFDEKISWLKLNTYSNNPCVRRCADKLRVREYITECGCNEILNELNEVYDKIDDIPWDTLPRKFVLKWNVGSGGNIICIDRDKLDIEEAKKKLIKYGKKKYHLSNAEMQYKNIPRKILHEKYLESEDGDLPVDYKFYCYYGDVKYVMVCTGRVRGVPSYLFYDRSWNYLKSTKADLDPNFCHDFSKPEGMDEAFSYASIISKPFPFVRADFYLVNGKPIFGELTFTPCGGMDEAYLEEADLILGKDIQLLQTI